MTPRWTARGAIALALVTASLASLGVLWGLSWTGAEDAVSAALADHLVAEAALAGEHLREVPVDVLVGLGAGHATAAITDELDRLRAASGLHDAALLGPDGRVLGSDGGWLPQEADADLIATARGGHAVAGPLYRAEDGALYLTAYAPLPEQEAWVVAVEGSATLGAVDQLARRQAIASGVVLAVVALLGSLLASWIARPLRELEAQLDAVQPGDAPDAVVPAGPREVHRVAAAARRLLEAIRERDAAVSAGHLRELEQVQRLAAEIAHEVRNPLNAMSLSTARLARLDDPDRRQVIAERLEAQIRELDAIITRLVDLTRPLDPRTEAIDGAALVARLAADATADVQYLGPEEWLLTSDATLLTEILRNLVLNAEQAGASTVICRVSGPPWCIEVEDDGPGIDDPAHLFDWFHTTRAQGSGLGLPISRRIAERLGGRLVLASAHPATFQLELPSEGP